MKTKYYDIESLPNVFTMAVYDPDDNEATIFVLDDSGLAFDPETPNLPNPEFARLIQSGIINKANASNFANGKIRILDLRDEQSAIEMAEIFGCSDGENSTELPWALKADTDPTFDIDEDYLLLGYNSFNYDTTMLAVYFDEAWRPHEQLTDDIYDEMGVFVREDIVYVDGLTGREFTSKEPPRAYLCPNLTARMLRDHNDNLFTSDFKRSMTSYLTAEFDVYGNVVKNADGEPVRNWNTRTNNIRQAMLKSGRYLDVARLNEKQSHVGLKRLLGLIGCQILEADLSGEPTTPKELAELIAYNVSDVVNLHELAEHWLYKNQAATKASMLDTYPELVYEFDRGRSTKPVREADGRMKVDRNRIRRNRLYRDSSSQQLSSRTLCPEGHLHDKEHVSLVYPCDEKAKEANIEPFDVLDMISDFYENRVLPRIADDEIREMRREEFARVIAAYSDVRGSNFDSGKDYVQQYGTKNPAKNLKDTPTICVEYLDGEGNPTGCYVSFSTGGIHGAEYNKPLYDADTKAYREAKALMDVVTEAYGTGPDGAVALRNSVAKSTAPIPLEFPDGKEHYVREFLKSGFTKTRAYFKPLVEPKLFKTSFKGNMALEKKYVFTSANLMNHEDFKSYYPGLLRQMGVFDNPDLGYDRYGEIFEDKERLGAVMKDKSLTQAERDDAAAQRNNVKLILNSASGGGDASFDTPILMNNNIIAMRLIGQMFTWYIGQAQSLEGARVPSTNTDGLYTVLEQKLNDEILEREAARINVPIEPEPVWLISKDANNRVEFLVNDDGSVKVLSASGDLACWRGPNPGYSLDHPAVIDRVLVDYLVEVVLEGGQDELYKPFDDERCRKFLERELAEGSYEHRLSMFQNVLASSPASVQYVFAERGDERELLQHYNRVFMMKPDFAPDSKFGFNELVELGIAAGTRITPAVASNRARNNLRTYIDDPDMLALLNTTGIDAKELHADNREATRKKVGGIEVGCPILVENRSTKGMPDDMAQALLDGIDLDRYLVIARNTYEKNWRNVAPKTAMGAETEE